jgi:hypothetical protein
VVFPPLWIALWTTTPAVKALLAGIALVALVLFGELYGYFRSVVGILLFAAIAYWGLRASYSAVSYEPEPEIADVRDLDLKYVCTMCGLELKVEVAAQDKAPKHCGEPMQLVRSGGRPPLHSV